MSEASPAFRQPSLPAALSFELTLSQVAELAGGDIVRGEPSLALRGVAALDAATTPDVSFLGNEKYRAQFASTRAGAVIVPRGQRGGPPECALVEADNPSLAFAAVIRHFAAASRPFEPGIHPRAWVDPAATLDPTRVRVHPGAVVMAGARIGDGSEIGPNAVVGEDVVIGRDCRVMANVTIRERCVLGERVILQPGCVIGSDGYGYERVDGRHVKVDQVGIVELGDDVEIGANTTIDRARFGVTRLGRGTKIDNLVQIAHNVTIGEDCLVVAQTGLAGSCHLGDRCTVAAQTGVAGHVSVGADSTLVARTGVTKNLPGRAAYSGMPALPLREDHKMHVHLRRLPELAERVKALEKALDSR